MFELLSDLLLDLHVHLAVVDYDLFDCNGIGHFNGGAYLLLKVSGLLWLQVNVVNDGGHVPVELMEKLKCFISLHHPLSHCGVWLRTIKFLYFVSCRFVIVEGILIVFVLTYKNANYFLLWIIT